MMFMLVLMSFGLMLMLNAVFTIIIIICYICGLSHYIYTYMLLYIYIKG